MSRLGPNVKLTLSATERDNVAELFAGALGAKAITPIPDMDVYIFPDGSRVGAHFIDPKEALTPAQQRLGAWLEFLVEDLPAAIAACEAAGCKAFPYGDGNLTYLAGPGGFCFRLDAAG